MRQKRNVYLLAAIILNLAYIIYRLATVANTFEGFESSNTLFMNTIYLIGSLVVATVLNFIAWVSTDRWFAIASACFCILGIAILPAYFPYVILQIALLIVGFVQITKTRKESNYVKQ